jgi:inorganic triphosphatase YgiF
MPGEIEVELKLRADGNAPLDLLAGRSRLGPAGLGSAHTVSETDVYLDTADGRLAAAGWACRYRTRDGSSRISLKGPPQDSGDDALHRRPELEGPVDDPAQPRTWPPSPARDHVLALAGDARLGERLTLQQERTERDAVLDGARIGILSLDRVWVLRRERSVGAFQVVELELTGKVAASVVDALATALRATPGLRPEPGSKLELALALLEPAAQPGP